MNIKHFLGSLPIAVICLTLVTSMAIAQQPVSTFVDDGLAQDPSSDGSAPLVVRPGQDNSLRPPFISPQDQDFLEGQAVVLNTKYAGWEEVTETSDGERISDKIRGNWIMVDVNGRFDGRVTAGAGADVSDMSIFLMNMGRLVKQTRTNPDGSFEFTNVRQGAYALIGWGENGFFAFGMNVLAYNENNNGTIVNTVNPIAFQNETTINTDWIQYYAPQVNFRVYGRYPEGEGRDDPPSLYGFKGLFDHLPESTLATSISGRVVNRTPDGQLLGRVHQFNSIGGRPVDVRSTTVMLFEGDVVVASTTTDNYGGFAFQEVPDGSYGLAAVGVDGVGLIAINVEGTNPDTAGETDHIDFTMTSSETIGWLNKYATEVAYRRALLAPRPPAAPDPTYGCPTCGNPGCGGCQSPYANCKSRYITFGQWAQMGCRANAQQYGDGSIMAGWARQQRVNVSRSKAIYNKAFYPEPNINTLYQNQFGPQN